MRDAFPNRAYGLPVGGTKADVEKFTVEQVRNYYQTYYSPDNATLVITGDFATEPVLKVVKETFGKLPKRAKDRLVFNKQYLASSAMLLRQKKPDRP